jgi:hypothetical protein
MYIILSEIIKIFNCYGMTATQLTKFVPLYSCNNITLKMAGVVGETCWLFIYIYVMDNILLFILDRKVLHKCVCACVSDASSMQ